MCPWKLFLSEDSGQWLLRVKSLDFLGGEKGGKYTKIVSVIMERACESSILSLEVNFKESGGGQTPFENNDCLGLISSLCLQHH